MSEVLDCVIVGQGLAGSWVTQALAGRAWKLRVFDDTGHSAASRVASGMMTPLTGKRLVPTWRLETLLPAAIQAYRAQEASLGLSLVDARPSLRVFRSEDEAERWKLRAQNPALSDYLGQSYPPGARLHEVEMPFGGSMLHQGARIRVQDWLSAMRDKMLAQGIFEDRPVQLSSIAQKGELWQVEGLLTKRIVFCIGHRASEHTWSSKLPFKNARGDLLEVQAPPVSEHLHLQTGVSLTALEPGRALVGGNYDWRDTQSGPNPGQAANLRERMEEIVGQPLVLLGHRSGVRPIVEGRVPVLGQLFGRQGVYLLNGLASKGTMWAPWMASHLVDVMDGRCQPDPELCVQARYERFGSV